MVYRKDEFLATRRQRVALATIVKTALETARPLLDGRRQTLDLQLPSQPVWLDADPLRIAQVIANLLANAAKNSEPGGRVVLGAEVEENRVAIRVRDDGIGIEPASLPRIFEMFSQAKSSLERAEGGLGTGLALVKGLVELHDGTVEATSAGLGEGAEFVVRLPLTAEALGAAPEIDDASREKPSTRAVRILVADDNRDAAASLATLLTLDGHEIAVAHDGEAALASAEAFRPDVALLDIGMPNLNGYEVAQSIRAAQWGRSMLLVAVTGWGQSEDKRRAHEAGFDHHFTKPLDFDAFGTFLNDALTRQRD